MTEHTNTDGGQPADHRVSRRTVLKATGALGAATLLPTGSVAGQIPTIDDALDTATDTPQQVLVVFDSNADVDHLRHLNLADGYFKFKVLPVGYARLTGSQIEMVASWPDVRYVQANEDLEFHNDDAREVTGVDVVQDQLFYTGETVHAVAIDSGVDGDHPDLANNLQHNFRFVDPLDEETMWIDAGPADTASGGHGTHVSGTIAGDGTESEGRYRGMAPDADLTVYSTDAVAALLQIVGAYDDMIDRQRSGKHDVQVVNNSYGPTSGNDADYNPNGALEVATWTAFEEGILPVFSAGNSGPGTNTLNNYAKGPHILGSAATDDDMAVTDFSSRGRTQDYAGGGEGANWDRQLAFSNLRALYSSGYGDQPVVAEETFTGTVGPGSSDAGVGESTYVQWAAPSDAGYLELSVSWTPQGQDIDVYVHEGSEGGPVIASGATLDNPEEMAGAITPGETYFVELVPYANVTASYTANLTARQSLAETERPTGPYGVYRPSAGTPGDYVMSTMSPDDAYQAYPLITQNPEEQGTDVWYGRLSGTSMSGPVLAGIVALVYDAHYQNHGSYPDPVDVINLIEATANDALAGHNTWNIGAGFADAATAVERAEVGDYPTFDDVHLAVDGEATEPVFQAAGARADDGSVFTAGQTDQVEITLTDASGSALVRDEIPFGWTVVGGDAATVYTDDGHRYVEFDEPASAGETLTYFIEAPDSTGSYEFGPAEARPADGSGAWLRVTGTETNEVLGVDTSV